MDGGLIARRYATVLYEYGAEKGKTAEIYDDVNIVRGALSENPRAKELLGSPLTKGAEKKALLSAVFGGRVSQETSDFMSFVVDKEREEMLDEILRVYQVVYKEHNGIKTAEVTTAKELTAEKQSALTAQLSAKLGTQVEVSYKSDASLIGGVIIRVDGKQLDLSVARQLSDIEKELTV
ncbi:MAG: ATP synthase F1 subunit delta [Bacteroidales bacterium]|nr:ATP synthase F1 subunit delta [Bacteroidales bacterium]